MKDLIARLRVVASAPFLAAATLCATGYVVAVRSAELVADLPIDEGAQR